MYITKTDHRHENPKALFCREAKFDHLLNVTRFRFFCFGSYMPFCR